MLSFAAFRALAGYAGYKINPVVVARYDSTTQDLVIDTADAASISVSRIIDAAVSSITAGGFLEIEAATTAAVSSINYANTTGKAVILAIGAAAAEALYVYLWPTGVSETLSVRIPSGSRLSLKSTSGTLSTGIVGINFLG